MRDRASRGSRASLFLLLLTPCGACRIAGYDSGECRTYDENELCACDDYPASLQALSELSFSTSPQQDPLIHANLHSSFKLSPSRPHTDMPFCAKYVKYTACVPLTRQTPGGEWDNHTLRPKTHGFRSDKPCSA